jgi:hypothetical protein
MHPACTVVCGQRHAGRDSQRKLEDDVTSSNLANFPKLSTTPTSEVDNTVKQQQAPAAPAGMICLDILAASRRKWTPCQRSPRQPKLQANIWFIRS